ncbi:unnamed protein product [Larinioides sclopetarius]|uniref:Carboxylic ester hydrolase n=1 Tax=Larinioides sclopetarius TaxID=280406 RepID=A0AAV1YTJ0_9ARAC
MEKKLSSDLTVNIGVILFLLNNFSCEPVVQIGSSYLYGQSIKYWNYEVYQFLSVPYAQPPLGKLRFQKPMPIVSYPKILKAVNMPPDCKQYTVHPFPWYNFSSSKSEDCLYLNIWTPSDASSENRKAVMYWIHGGGFRYDSIQNDVYTGTVLAAKGDIIVVTVNYRLGPFGFFTTGTNEAPGNVGIWDILEGLRWVNKYIGNFGGDNSRITIAGESAGSIAVGLLAVSPLAESLYSRQIMQTSSPTYLAAENNTQNLALSQQLAKMAGCASDSFTIKEHPRSVTECLQSNPQLIGFFGEKNPRINKTTGKYMIRKFFKDFPNPESVVRHYLPDDVPEHAYDFVRFQVATAAGDFLVVCPDVYHAEQCAEKGGKVYSYFWIHRPSDSPWAPWMGAVHFTEVQFIFGRPFLHPSDYQIGELGISKQMIEIWSNFVKNGKPNLEFWPFYTKQNPTFKYLGGENQKPEYDLGTHKENCEFFRPYFRP